MSGEERVFDVATLNDPRGLTSKPVECSRRHGEASRLNEEPSCHKRASACKIVPEKDSDVWGEGTNLLR